MIHIKGSSWHFLDIYYLSDLHAHIGSLSSQTSVRQAWFSQCTKPRKKLEPGLCGSKLPFSYDITPPRTLGGGTQSWSPHFLLGQGSAAPGAGTWPWLAEASQEASKGSPALPRDLPGAESLRCAKPAKVKEHYRNKTGFHRLYSLTRRKNYTCCWLPITNKCSNALGKDVQPKSVPCTILIKVRLELFVWVSVLLLQQKWQMLDKVITTVNLPKINQTWKHSGTNSIGRQVNYIA